MSLSSTISAVVVNFQTPDLLENAVRSFKQAYPDVPLLIVDNGSQDQSPAVISSLAREFGETIDTAALQENRFHGPALDFALRRLTTPYVYVFDSDTITHKEGFLEPMLEMVSTSDRVYGSGKIVLVNRRGFAVREGIPVLASAYMLLDRRLYLELPPFVHHGLPALANFKAAAERGLELRPYPIEEYVEHLGRGTAERFGYGLGIRSRLDYILHKLGF